jgi:hypothetical protein
MLKRLVLPGNTHVALQARPLPSRPPAAPFLCHEMGAGGEYVRLAHTGRARGAGWAGQGESELFGGAG